MDRWDWMAVRAYVPTAGLLLAALVSTGVLTRLQASPLLAGLVSGGKWLPVLLLTAAVVHFAWVTYRLCQADKGKGLLCGCGGLLGHERAGRASRGGAYRRCYACGRNINHHRYE
ncbi:hypothetical protein [Novilysobacter erysipheiresistens]|uniref:Uncharacterized protein n=1 Tax=Novilysobacter erysipheiresistens TaxID=1749332 RepID=A0ABU7YTV5_9GAMM